MIPEGPARLGGWTADRLLGRLARDGQEHALEPKVMDLLLLLSAKPGRVVSHDELREALWPDVIVGDDSLARAVSKLRAVLARLEGSAGRVETVPKRGYRLMPPAGVAPAGDPPAVAGVLAGRATRRVEYLLALIVILLAALAISLHIPKRGGGVTDTEVARARSLGEADAARARAAARR